MLQLLLCIEPSTLLPVWAPGRIVIWPLLEELRRRSLMDMAGLYRNWSCWLLRQCAFLDYLQVLCSERNPAMRARPC